MSNHWSKVVCALMVIILMVNGLLVLVNCQDNITTTTTTTQTTKSDKEKIKVDVYYETLCPDSIRFLLFELISNYNLIKNQIDLHLYAFGKAEIYEFGTTYDFYCQHGPKECRANMIHCCVIDDHNGRPEETFPFIKCMEQELYRMARPNIDNVAIKCANSTNLDWKKIDDCASGERGKKLLLEAGRKTKSIKPKISFVPTVIFNDKFSDQHQNQALYGGFVQLVHSLAKNSSFSSSLGID